jgi:hypothetical protein
MDLFHELISFDLIATCGLHISIPLPTGRSSSLYPFHIGIEAIRFAVLKAYQPNVAQV